MYLGKKYNSMENTLNFFIFLFYMLSALSIWSVMASYKKNLILIASSWIFWIIAIIAHSYALSPIFDESLSVNLSINYIT